MKNNTDVRAGMSFYHFFTVYCSLSLYFMFIVINCEVVTRVSQPIFHVAKAEYAFHLLPVL
jgi:Na+-translocating ferredoxin:NAD+ oxidoreductase RnfE subunit